MSKRTVITSESAGLVTLTANVTAANVPTPIFRFTAPRGAEFVIPNQFQSRGGLATGFDLKLDLNLSTGVRIRGGSRIEIAVLAPGWESPRRYRTLPYSIWRDVTLVQQKSAEFVDQIAGQIDLNVGPGLVLMQDYQFIISVQGPDQVDWTRSYLEFATLEGRPGEFSGVR
jgi:hypothetical protein